MGRNKPCEHTSNAGTFHERELRVRAKGTCDACDAPGPNLWLCLEGDCGYVGCGESAKDHSTEHTQSTSHQLTLNLYTLRVWCYECEIEVFPDSVMREAMDDQQILIRQRMVMEREAERVVQRESKWEIPPRLPTLARIDSLVTQAMDEFLNDDPKPRGLTGLRNLGNTCYMNAGIQALSNCPPFTHFFLECPGYVKTEKKPYLAKTYQKLMEEIWGRRRPSYLTPSSLINTIKTVFPMFKGFTQQDTQEFLRCFMDRLHEELKEPIIAGDTDEEGEEEETAEPQPVEHSRRTRSRDSLCQSDGEQSIPDNDEVASQTSDGDRLPNKNRRLRKRSSPEADQQSESSDATVTQEERRSISKYEQDLQNSEKDIDETETVQYNESLEEGSGETEETREQPERRTRKSSYSKITRSPSHEDVARTAGRKQHSKFRSIVSDVFDGKILSSVQCLTCDLVSTRRETFQDLSLPIPGKEDLARIHASQGMPSKSGVPCSDTYGRQGWFSWIYSWVTGWFWGPSVTLDDCLAAFFSADDLKGDNMYSCDKCKKLRNGVKFSQVVDLPEMLCIHLKRFRHESLTSYSSKIGSYVAFPMEGLDMSPYLVNKGNTDKVTVYDLASVICHHGTAGGGHYTAYAQNWLNGQWYEYDDVYVTEVSDMQVANCEAYVLFYRKVSDDAIRERQKVSDMCDQQEPSLLHFYVSLEWLNKFNTFAEPGPISNNDFLCKHGGVPPSKASYVDQLVVKVPQPVWQYLHDKFGGGPAVNHLYACATCQKEMEQLERRRREEMQTFIKLNDEFQADDSPSSIIFCISLSWFKQWEAFVKAKQREPPGPIDNRPISIIKAGHATLRHGADSGQISEDMWQYLHSIYDGGPEIILRPNRPAQVPEHPASNSSGTEEDMDTSNTGSRDDQNRV